ncbi:helix-turn-helix transcriptional regulator [Kordiimonas sp.]|uniref:helix-turn-helix transcriptional regulator n=1 Tax=Kordiimonas sp. TaxID=1970157 RepID=UPI003A9463F4
MDLEYFRLAVEFIEASKKVKTLEALSAAFQKSYRPLGFDHYACISCVEFGSMPEGAVFIADYPADWSNHYLEEHFGRTDRILQVSLKEHMPFNWDSSGALFNAPTSSADPETEAKSTNHEGMLFGITVPIHIVGSFPGAVNVVGANRQVDPAAEHSIHLMSVYLHDAALRLAKKEKRAMRPLIRLTPRERECLQWVAAGKTDWEIAAILSIAERTVHNHIEGAKAKLEVNSRVQAVVKAFLSNLIY